MKADRELDARIAEEVMGWKVNYDNWTVEKPHDERPNTFWQVPLTVGWGAWKPSAPDGIADAWLVVEKLGKLTGKDVLVEHCADGERLCTLGWHYRGIWMKDIQEKADTAPLAICLVALEAVK